MIEPTDVGAHGPHPTVGRIVHLWGRQDQEQPLAGIITATPGDRSDGYIHATALPPHHQPMAVDARYDARGRSSPDLRLPGPGSPRGPDVRRQPWVWTWPAR